MLGHSGQNLFNVQNSVPCLNWGGGGNTDVCIPFRGFIFNVNFNFHSPLPCTSFCQLYIFVFNYVTFDICDATWASTEVTRKNYEYLKEKFLRKCTDPCLTMWNKNG